MNKTKKTTRWGSLVIAVILLQICSYGNLPVVGSSTWEPDKFSEWTVAGPDGGDVRAVAIDPRDKDRLYISTLDGQVYTSADAGKSWRLLVNLNKPQLVLDNLFVDSRDSKVIYVSGNRGKAPGGFFKSTDGGITWKEAKDLRNTAIHAMTQSASDPDMLTVGTTEGIWVSRNSGNDWEKVESDTMPLEVDSLAVDPRNPSTIFAGTWWRAYKSTDTGKNWRLIKDGMIDDSDVFAIDIDPRNADHIIASACSGIYESTNSGEKWAKMPGIPSQSRRTRDILQHPTVPGTIYAATTEGFWMSSDAGKHWIITTQRELEINSIAVHPDAPNRVFIGTNNYGVMVSNDGGRNFVPTNANFSSRFTYSVTADSQTPDRLYAATQNTATGGGFFFISGDRGKTWMPAKNLDTGRVVPFVTLQDKENPNVLYLGANLGIYRSVDRGLNWTQLTAPKDPPVKKGTKTPVKGVAAKKPAAKPPVRTTAVTARNPVPGPDIADKDKPLPVVEGTVKVLTYTTDGKNGILAGTDKGLFRTYDISKGWEKLSFGEGLNDNVFAIHSSPQRPGTLWVGTATSGVIVSHDDGKTWTQAGGAIDGVPISSIASDPKRPDYIYVGSSQSFYVSRDAGATWNRRGGNLPLGNFTSILIDPSNTDEILISSSLEGDGGIFLSTDAGVRWKRIDSKDMKLASRRVWTMIMDPNDANRIFAGTHSGGVYRIEKSTATTAANTADGSRTSHEEE